MRKLILKEIFTGLGDNILIFSGWKIIADKLNLKVEIAWNKLVHPLSINPIYDCREIPNHPPHISIDIHKRMEYDPIPWQLLHNASLQTVVVQQGWQPLFNRLIAHAPLSLTKEEIINQSRKNIWLFFEEILNIPSALKQEIQHNIQLINEAKKGRDLIGIHLRVGGGADHTFTAPLSGKQINPSDEDLIRQTFIEIKESLEKEGYDYTKKALFLLVGDVDNELLLKHAKAIFAPGSFFMTISGQPRHMRISTLSVEDWKKILLDFLVLASCNRLYITVNSHFSRIAALMASDKVKDFNYWFVELNTPIRKGNLEELFFKPRNSII